MWFADHWDSFSRRMRGVGGVGQMVKLTRPNYRFIRNNNSLRQGINCQVKDDVHDARMMRALNATPNSCNYVHFLKEHCSLMTFRGNSAGGPT
jgi:hypothetical protein